MLRSTQRLKGGGFTQRQHVMAEPQQVNVFRKFGHI
jgi:hypothetical protein